jgi:hypothetical protein
MVSKDAFQLMHKWELCLKERVHIGCITVELARCSQYIDINDLQTKTVAIDSRKSFLRRVSAFSESPDICRASFFVGIG